jgi:hypothetical protein
MNTAAKITARGACLALAAGLSAFTLAACAAPGDTAAAPVTATAKPSPTTTTVSELPEWARVSSPWLIYPDGMECVGTEGCPNDFRALIGEPSDPLPEGVEIYDPERHDGRVVFPLEQSPYLDENGQRLDGDYTLP